MKTLVVPDLPEWERNKYTLLKMLKPGEAIMLPASWGVKKMRLNIRMHYPNLVSRVKTYKRMKYMAVKINEPKNQVLNTKL